MKLKTAVSSIGLLFALLAGQTAQAIPVIAFEWTEGGPGSGVNSPHISHHASGGPVLADDFTPVVSGRVTRIDWWGSAPLSASGTDFWEATFHPTDPTGAPAPDTTIPTGILSQHFVNAGGADADGDGVFFYTAAWIPQFPGDVTITAGNSYWFSIANSIRGWTWANAGGAAPTVGTENFDAVVSNQALGNPHFGPWTPIPNQDFAFRIWVDAVPEPSIAMLLGIGLIGIGAVRARRWL